MPSLGKIFLNVDGKMGSPNLQDFLTPLDQPGHLFGFWLGQVGDLENAGLQLTRRLLERLDQIFQLLFAGRTVRF